MNIRNDIPPPPKYRGRPVTKHYANVLEVGDSYFVEASTESVAYAIKAAYRKPNCGHKQFRREKRTEEGVVGYRVWRVA